MRFTSRMHFQQTFQRPLYGHTIDQIRRKKSENNGKSLLYHHGEYDGLRMLLGAERKRCCFFCFCFVFLAVALLRDEVFWTRQRI